MFLNPQEHTGDRAALLIVAFLIVITNLQADLGLGKLHYLIWYDYLNLLVSMLLCVTLIETMLVHQLCHGGHIDAALIIDRVSRASSRTRTVAQRVAVSRGHSRTAPT